MLLQDYSPLDSVEATVKSGHEVIVPAAVLANVEARFKHF